LNDILSGRTGYPDTKKRDSLLAVSFIDFESVLFRKVLLQYSFEV